MFTRETIESIVKGKTFDEIIDYLYETAKQSREYAEKIERIYNTVDNWEKYYQNEKKEKFEEWNVNDQYSTIRYDESVGACIAVRCIKQTIH